jgi:hypothetical protein
MGLLDDMLGQKIGGLLGYVTNPNGYASDVLSGRGLLDTFGSSSYDPNRSLAQNALDPRGIQQAMNIGMSMGPGAIKAYHGSPYDFTKFDASKIGTGEGAQAYGHGLYFADNPKVAQTYRDALGQPAVEIGGEKIVPPRGSPEDIALAHLETAHFAQSGNPYGYARQSLRSAYDLAPNTPTGTMRKDLQQAMDVLGRWQEQGAVPGNSGKMYEVNINAEPEHLLDYDRPVKDQPHLVSALNQIWEKAGGTLEGRTSPPFTAYPEASGQSALAALSTTLNSPAVAAQKLQNAGIPGIRYLDQGSRGSGQGTSNYVVFDPSIVDILKKYGLAGMTAGTGAAATGGLLDQ